MTHDDIEPFGALIHAAYIDYTTTVSEPAWAVSHETASLLAWLCAIRQPDRVCDLGSGFSSYTLRRSCLDVTSVDTDPEWLARTYRFLDQWGLPTNQLMLWPDWSTGTDTYDLVFVDIAQGDLREEAMRPAVERLNRGGIVVFDDAQHDSHNHAMRQTITDHGLDLIDVRHLTLDGIGRYALAAIKE